MKKYPVIIFTLLFCAGLISGHYYKLPVVFLFACLGLLIISAIINKIFDKYFLTKLLLSFLVYSGILLLGNFYFSSPAPFSMKKELHKQQIAFWGTISDINLSSNELKFQAECDSVEYKGNKILFNGKFYCILDPDSGYGLTLSPGNKISLEGIFYRAKNKRNPGEFDYDNYLNKKGIAGIIYINPEGLKITDHGNFPFRNIIYKTRRYLADEFGKFHDKNTASLLKGLILGDRSEIDGDIRNGFINTGTAHILAVSGLHVGYIILIFIFLTGRLNVYLRTFLTAIGIILFVFISGASPSVVRASIMALVFMIAFITNRSTNLYNSLALSAMIILLLDPSQIFSPGFQLSFAAVISIAAIYPVLRDHLNKIDFKHQAVKKLILFFAVSFAAQIGTLPFVLYYFSKLSLVSLLTNLFVVPLAGFIIGSAFTAIIFIPVIPVIAGIFASSNMVLSSLLFYLISIAGNPDYSFLWVYDFSLFDGIIFYFGLIFFLIYYSKIRTLSAKIAFSFLLILNVVILTSLDNKEFPGKGDFYCYMIDVGQGDAILIKFPSGKTALIDAGDATENFDFGERVIEPLLNYSGIKRIDYAFVSHLDKDHYSGFVHLIYSKHINYLYKPSADTSLRDRKFENFLKQYNVKCKYYTGGSLNVDNVKIYFLKTGEIHKKLSLNDRSAVIYIKYGQTGFLFTGDAGIKAEKEYVNRYGRLLKANVLKVSHHGSTSASSEEFLSFAAPEISLISAGEKNKFGHPSKKTLNKLYRTSSKVYRTDEEGGILLKSDGYNVTKLNWN